MRAPPDRPMLRAVHEPTRIVLRLEIERDREPLSGRLTAARRSVAFTGWIGLAAAIEQFTASPAATGPPAERWGAMPHDPPRPAVEGR